MTLRVQAIILALAMLTTMRQVNAQSLARARVGLSSIVAAEHARHFSFIPRIQSRSRWREGMIIGAIVGVGAGFAANSFIASASDDPNHHFSYPTLIASTFAFAVIGSLIGSSIRR